MEENMPTLTFRKLIKFGENGVVVTIPKGWQRYYGLKAGDRLEVIANEELIIRPVIKSKKTKQSIG